jgi:hypothetical protein
VSAASVQGNPWAQRISERSLLIVHLLNLLFIDGRREGDMLRALDKLVNIDSSMILLLLLHLMLLLIFALDVETRARFARRVCS